MNNNDGIERLIISVLVDNEPGVLARVIGLFRTGLLLKSYGCRSRGRVFAYFHCHIRHADGD